MKIRVISEFYDKYHTSTLFKVGAVLDFDDARAKDVIAKKLAVEYVEEKKEPVVKKQDKPKEELKPESKAEQRQEVKPEVKPDGKAPKTGEK